MSSSSAIVCKEIFDENSQPSVEEISDYAQQIGIDPESESHLLPLAKDGLMQALPPPWKAYFDEKLQTHYYYNEETKKTQWEHPLDRVYRDLVRKARDSSTQDDTCASVQELLTSEENTKYIEKYEVKAESDNEDLSTDNSEENASDNKESTNIGTRRLQPIARRPPLAPLTRPSDKKLSDLRISPLRRSIDSTLSIKPRGMPELNHPFERPKLFKQQSEIIDLKMHVLNSPDDENFSPLMPSKSEKGFALTGKGSIFLKTKKHDLPSPDTEKSLPLDSMTKSDPPKGILREKTDSLQRKSELAIGKPKQTASFEDDRKSVRFNLENSALENTVSPGSNSSSDQNEGHSVISSPPVALSSLVTPSTNVPASPTVPPPPFVLSSPKMPSMPLTLAPLVSRPPLPPRPQTSIENILSPRDFSQRSSLSGSERESNESDRGTSPRRRVVKPPPADYIKPDLFQKNFQKISDLVRPGDLEPVPRQTLGFDDVETKEKRPRSPMIPQKSKISINLMESIDSETSIDSPDKEFANLDLNDLDESNESKNYDNEKVNDSINDDEQKQRQIKPDNNTAQCKTVKVIDSMSVPLIKVPKLDLLKSKSSHGADIKNVGAKEEMIDSKTNSRSDSLDLGSHSKEYTHQNRVVVSPQLKVSPSISVSSYKELRSPRADLYSSERGWSSPFKPVSAVNKAIIAPQIKSSDSNSNLSLTKVTSPRLDGVILSQNKSTIKGSDNVVVMYQFEANDSVEDSSNINAKVKNLNHDSNREVIERAKVDERKRLEISLQNELESIRLEWAEKEKKLKTELIEELRELEDIFSVEKRKKIAEQAERHKLEMEQALEELQRSHEERLQANSAEYEDRLRKEKEAAERKHQETMLKLKEDYSRLLAEEQTKLQLENERLIIETREQLHCILVKEREKGIEDNRKNLESLREEHTARIAELRHDYRAEVERLRAQHACHLEELRGRLANERAAASRRGQTDNHALADKYRCLKEKYARLKHDVKMSIERRNKRREMSMTTGSETEKSNSHKATQSLERCKELNEPSASAAETADAIKVRNNNPVIKYNDNETSLSESNAQKSFTDNNNDDWRNRKDAVISPETSQASGQRAPRPPRKVAVAFREPPRRRRERDSTKREAATTDCQDSSDATTADEKPKEALNGHGRRRCFTRLKSASTSRLNYSPKRGEGWSSPLESLRQQLRKLDDLEDQFPDLACQPAYSLRYPFGELGSVSTADTPELEFVRHRALIEREGMRRARAVLRRRRAALRQTQTEVEPSRAPSVDTLTLQEATTSDASSGSDMEVGGHANEAASGVVLKSLRALHADVRDIWLALDARRPTTASPETSSCNAASTSHPRMNLSAEASRTPDLDAGVTERARGLRAWLQAP